MAVVSTWYPKGLMGLMSGGVDWDWDTDDVSGTIMIALFNNSHTFDPDTQDFFNDIVANEITGTGYAANGTIVPSRSLNHDAAGTVQLRAGDPAWPSASFTAYHAVVYKRTTGANSAWPLLVNINFGGAEQVTSGTFTVDFDATAGVATVAFPGT